MSQDPFEAARPRIRGLAYRMLGTLADADDVVQDTWLRWHAADGAHIANAEAWLVTAATRLCLDRLRSTARVREIYPGPCSTASWAGVGTSLYRDMRTH